MRQELGNSGEQTPSEYLRKRLDEVLHNFETEVGVTVTSLVMERVEFRVERPDVPTTHCRKRYIITAEPRTLS